MTLCRTSPSQCTTTEGFQAANESDLGEETCLFAAQQHDSGGSSADYSTTGTAEVDEENKMIERMAGNTSTKKKIKLQVKNSYKKKKRDNFSLL